MAHGPAAGLQVFLCDEESAGRIRVEIDAFVRFSAEIDAALIQLEAKWPLHRPLQALVRGPGKRSRNREWPADATDEEGGGEAEYNGDAQSSGS